MCTKKLPVVIATTGLSENTKQKMEEASYTIPIFYSANMSLGINVLIEALQKITPALEDDFNIEIVEKHHNQKKMRPVAQLYCLLTVSTMLLKRKRTMYSDEAAKKILIL
ncbi:hypothetical protein GCM10025853_28790 [Tetragenococcus halophilus subsp. halophilus DSM 20339]|nr:hypothetical protein GCM10025853_28790 [Tetragenococcus halophilus subsp. halophilus DSM 20339]